MSAVAGDFNDLAKISSVPMSTVDLSAVLGHIQIAYPGLDLAVPAGAWMVRGAEASMLRVFNNLLNNSLESMPAGRSPALSVSLRDDEGAVLVLVRDNGCGIEISRWESIFEPHFTTKSSGSGLGLAMVKSIVEGMDGRIWVEASSAEGTEFNLRLLRA
jgi:C4-dicarboxylate-specific signal transduction histidine kinase